MKKSIWKKPNFEVETFVPNDYIANCQLTIVPIENPYGYVWNDNDNDRELDYTDPFSLENYQGSDTWWNGVASQQTLPTGQMTVERDNVREFVRNAVLLSRDGSPSNVISFNSVTVNVDNEESMTFFTGSDWNGHS